VLVFVKIDKEMRPWECPQTGTVTDANPFYYLSHAGKNRGYYSNLYVKHIYSRFAVVIMLTVIFW